jgi:hypothetical protein
MEKRRAFASIEGVASVEAGASSGNWHTFTVRGTGSLEEAVGAAAVRAGLGLRELTRAAPSLERIFLELIEGEEDPGKAEGGA